MPHGTEVQAWYIVDGKILSLREIQKTGSLAEFLLHHAFHYCGSAFAGIRCYSNRYVIRLRDHLDRLKRSVIEGLESPFPWDIEELARLTLEIVKLNIGEGYTVNYIRPVVWKAETEDGISLTVRSDKNRMRLVVMCIEWPLYLGEEAVLHGIDLWLSDRYARPASQLAQPTHHKLGVNYVQGQRAKNEAVRRGYADALMPIIYGAELPKDTGMWEIAEATGACFGVVRKDGRFHTPPLDVPILPGFTRGGFLKRWGMLYGEDAVLEAPLTAEGAIASEGGVVMGSAVEVIAVTRIDHQPIGMGLPHSKIEEIQRWYLRVVRGEEEDLFGWRTDLRNT